MPRLLQVRQHFDHVPAWRCEPQPPKKPFFICGKCFKKKGDGPFTSTNELWLPGTDTAGGWHHEVVPINAICEQCGGHAWPAD